MRSITAREVYNMSIQEVWDLEEGGYKVEYDDGKVTTAGSRMLIFNRYIWELYDDYDNTPLSSKASIESAIGDGFYDGRTLTKCFETTFGHICEHNDLFNYSEKEPLLKRVFEVLNNIYNGIVLGISEHVTTNRGYDFVEILNDPVIREIHADFKNTPESIADSYKRIEEFVRTTKSKNPLIRALRSGAIKMSQFCQCIGPRGFVTDLDRSVFALAIKSGFIGGMNTPYDITTESRTAGKALNASTESIRIAEYMARRVQIQGSSVEYAAKGDCGTTKTSPVFMSKLYLKNSRGKFYYEEGTNKLKYIKGDEEHLIDKVVNLRMVKHCTLDNPHDVCTVCAGLVVQNYPGNTNLGYLCGSDLSEKSSQRTLSFKHEVASVGGGSLNVVGRALEYLHSNRRSELLINKDVDIDQYSLVLNGRKLLKLVDVLSIDNDDVTMSRIGDLEQASFIDMTGREDVVKISFDDQNSNITRQLLRHIRDSKYEVNSRGNYVIPMKGWDKSLPVFEVPLKEADIGTFVRKVANGIEGTGNSKKLSYDEHFFNTFDTILEHIDCNMTVLEVLIYSLSARNPDEGDFRHSRNMPVALLSRRRDLYKARSFSQFFLFENQKNAMEKNPYELYDLRFRQRHPLDVLFIPQQVIARRNRELGLVS